MKISLATLKTLMVLITILFSINSFGQSDTNTNWDNQIYLGNKITFGENKWKFATELQTRLKNDFQQLDNWFIEFTANYLISKHVEIVPDFRASVKPTKTEIRLGIGLLLKMNTQTTAFTNQTKSQYDIDNYGNPGTAFREVLFVNHVINKKMMATLVAGAIYRWWPEWNGFQYIRVGPGLTYTFNEKHRLNMSYFVGVENNTKQWLWAGIPMIQLVININSNDNYDYTPANYFDF